LGNPNKTKQAKSTSHVMATNFFNSSFAMILSSVLHKLN